MAYDDSSASGRDEPWIQWFCGLRGHEMFCEVERSYIEDGFNLYGLRACVSNFSDCLDLILDRIGPDDSDDSHLTQSACTLYGLIHARYIITSHGLDAMYNKYANKEFGTCPLVHCSGQPCLPVGLKDAMGADTVKKFCPKCQCIYHPPPIRSKSHVSTYSTGSGAVDGAAFGTTFPHLFLMTFNNLVPDGLSPESAYVPRVFGFRVHQSAKQRNGTSITTVGSSHATTTTGAVLNYRRASNPASAPASAPAPVEGYSASVSVTASATTGINNGNGQNTADADAANAANNDANSSFRPLDQDAHAQTDKTAANPATAPCEKGKSTSAAGKSVKKGGNDSVESKGKGSGSSKAKLEDGGGKRKGKNYGDADSKNKRSRRPSSKT